MTAVEWLIQQIDNEDMGEIPMWVYDFCYDALELEKEQIMDAHLAGQNSAEEVDGQTEIQYYNETYKKQPMTAVEQFFKDLCDLGFIEYPDDAIVQNRLNLALETEKEQIMQAYKFNATGEPDRAEHYYEIFYKKYNK